MNMNIQEESYGQEWLNENAFEIYQGEKCADKQDELEQLTDDELLEEAIGFGPNLNIETFPAYDIAARIKKNGWKMTPRQREAIINVMAHHHVFGK
jgi:hypothetical protein